jgi:hypothetical protein
MRRVTQTKGMISQMIKAKVTIVRAGDTPGQHQEFVVAPGETQQIGEGIYPSGPDGEIIAALMKRMELITSVQVEVFDAGSEIIVNGKKIQAYGLAVSYEDLTAMAGYDAERDRPTIIYNLSRSDGSLSPGEKVLVKDGLEFDVVVTGDA